MILNEDQLAIRDLARRFAKERLAPHYQAREVAGVMDRKLLREMGDLGLLGADLPEKFGGLGVPGVTAGVIAEELAYGDFNISAVPVGVSLLGAILMSSATPAIAEQWVPRMISGDRMPVTSSCAVAGMESSTFSTAKRPRLPSPTVPTPSLCLHEQEAPRVVPPE